MRQVFSSPRLENVEGVVQLLKDAGIEVRVTHGRSFEGSRRRKFSYSDNDSPQPTVWVVNSADQVQARAILRDAGLLDTTRPGDSNAVNPFRFDPQTQAVKPQKRVLLIKMALMGGIALVMVLGLLHTLKQPSVPQVASPPFDGSVARTLEPVAVAVFASQLKDADLPVLCLSVDGADAPAAVIASLQDALLKNPSPRTPSRQVGVRARGRQRARQLPPRVRAGRLDDRRDRVPALGARRRTGRVHRVPSAHVGALQDAGGQARWRGLADDARDQARVELRLLTHNLHNQVIANEMKSLIADFAQLFKVPIHYPKPRSAETGTGDSCVVAARSTIRRR